MNKDIVFDRYTSTHPGLKQEFYQKDFEAVAEGYDKVFHSFLPSNKDAKILDVGCGQGYFLYYLKSRGYKNIIGVDISREQVEFCKKHVWSRVLQYDGVEYLVKAQSANESVDLIVMTDVLECIPKDEIIKLVSLVHGCLINNGVFLVKVPNQENPFNIATRYAEFAHTIGFTSGSLTQVLKLGGFQSNKITIHPYKCGTPRLAKRLAVRICSILLFKMFEIPYKPKLDHQMILNTRLIFAVARK